MHLDAIIAAIIDTVPEPYAARAIGRVRALGETKGQLAQLAEANPELLHVLETQHPDLIAELKRRLNAEPPTAVTPTSPPTPAPPASNEQRPVPIAPPVPTVPIPAPVPPVSTSPVPSEPAPVPSPAPADPAPAEPAPTKPPKKGGDRPSVPNF